MVIHDDSGKLKNHEGCKEMGEILPAVTLSGSDATKENVIERVKSRSASLVHFLVHGTPAGTRVIDYWFTCCCCCCFRAGKNELVFFFKKKTYYNLAKV